MCYSCTGTYNPCRQMGSYYGASYGTGVWNGSGYYGTGSSYLNSGYYGSGYGMGYGSGYGMGYGYGRGQYW